MNVAIETLLDELRPVIGQLVIDLAVERAKVKTLEKQEESHAE